MPHLTLIICVIPSTTHTHTHTHFDLNYKLYKPKILQVFMISYGTQHSYRQNLNLKNSK